MCTSQQTYYRVQLQGQLQDHRTVSLGDLLPVSWHHRPGGEAHRPFVTHHFQPLGPGRTGPGRAKRPPQPLAVPAASRSPLGSPPLPKVTSTPVPSPPFPPSPQPPRPYRRCWAGGRPLRPRGAERCPPPPAALPMQRPPAAAGSWPPWLVLAAGRGRRAGAKPGGRHFEEGQSAPRASGAFVRDVRGAGENGGGRRDGRPEPAAEGSAAARRSAAGPGGCRAPRVGSGGLRGRLKAGGRQGAWEAARGLSRWAGARGSAFWDLR